MKKIALAVLFGVFASAIACVSAGRLYEWYLTGQLTMHRKMPLGSDAVTYSSNPIGFLMEFDLYLIPAGDGIPWRSDRVQRRRP